MCIRKKLSLFLTLTMVLSLVFSIPAMPVFAADSDVIQVRTADDLYNVRNDLTANYKLMNDIDMTEATAVGGKYDNSGRGWEPIGNKNASNYGSYSAFTGTFDGNGHSIKGLRIDTGNKISIFSVGLFSYNEGTIKDLHLKDLSYSASLESYNRGFIGGIAGYNEGTITRCSTDGHMTGTSMGSSYSLYLGGISCTYNNTGSITECYSDVTIDKTGDYTNRVYAYGICYQSKDPVNDCFTTGNLPVASTFVHNSYRLTDDGCTYYNSAGASYNLTKASMVLEGSYTTFDFDNIWVINEYAYYKYPQLRNNMKDLHGIVDTLEWKSQPTKIDYYNDEEIDVTGGVITAYYLDDTHENITLTSDMVTDYDHTKTGLQHVTVTFRGKTITFDIMTSQRPEIQDMVLGSGPDQTEFVKGTAFDFTGAYATVLYTNGTSENIPITLEETTGGNINSSGVQTITFARFGRQVQFEVTVVPVKPVSLTLVHAPDKTVYIEGQSIDLSGMVVQLKYNNGKTEAISDYTIEPYENTVGKRDITVSYDEFTATFQVEFVSKSLVSLSVTQQPDKQSYIVGEHFDRSGMIVQATYDNGTTEEITGYEVADLTDTVGWQDLTVSYGGKTTTVRVRVSARELASISIEQLPGKTEYIEGDAFDPTGMVVLAHYNNNLSEEITDYTLSGTELKTLGENTITVLYGDFSATFTVNVTAKALVRLDVTPPDKKEYLKGEAFDSKGMVVKGVYNNGQSETITDYQMAGFGESDEDNVITVSYKDKSASFVVVIHTPEDEWTITQAPTCTAAGHKELHCKGCGKILDEANIDATGHNWGEWTQVTSPSCTDKGSKKRSCSSCGLEEYADVDAFGHEWETSPREDKPASCTEEGSQSIHCSVCGISDPATVEVINKLPHDMGQWYTVKAATCAAAGVRQRDCSNCEYFETEVIPATGEHSFDKWIVTKEATCVDKGSKYHECSVCGEREVAEIAATGIHTYGSWITIKEASCLEAGRKYHRCSECDNIEYKDIPAVGEHSFGAWTITAEPTCTQAGSKKRTCSACGETEIAEIPIKEHTWETGSRIDIAPTCTQEGSESVHCSVCGASDPATVNTIAMLAHSYTIWKVDKQPTYEGPGTKSLHCAVCGEVKPGSQAAIAKLTVKGTSLTKLTKAKKAITVKWNAGSNITGYQIQYGLKSSFKGAKIVNVGNAKSTSKKIKKLKAKKKYYVRIRTFKTVNGKNYYSAWSAKKSVKTK